MRTRLQIAADRPLTSLRSMHCREAGGQREGGRGSLCHICASAAGRFDADCPRVSGNKLIFSVVVGRTDDRGGGGGGGPGRPESVLGGAGPGGPSARGRSVLSRRSSISFHSALVRRRPRRAGPGSAVFSSGVVRPSLRPLCIPIHPLPPTSTDVVWYTAHRRRLDRARAM